MTMVNIVISKEKESLELATKILGEFFSASDTGLDESSEFLKWKNWFLQKSNEFNAGSISNTLYFNQISRIRAYLVSNTSLNANDLFTLQKQERIRGYDLTKLDREQPETISKQDLPHLAKILFDYLTTEIKSSLKLNIRVESITNRMRNERFGFKLDPDPNKNIGIIEDQNLYSNDLNRKYFLLGELFCELGELTEAENSYGQISQEKTQNTGLLEVALQRHSFDDFLSLLPQAYPESYKPEIYGRYILNFLIGNEKRFKYGIDESGNRYVSFAFSTGLIKIAHIDVFSAFTYDFRVAPDYRIGLWLNPMSSKNDYFQEIQTQLDHKEVLGWKNL